ncbi:hypothetical protein [Clostridium manihotivorum]|uniref:Gingipain domain-containing protein n=1 Tax=Clostridium manihotivorum TaxID=2320868 RepID=A0A3R5QSH0_9CLOT|nr:hypothetical protein [Clostridium manihotivorum]QAA31292.1 hypothetical protein C1I91_06365 [Clostridium manihotivorum]
MKKILLALTFFILILGITVKAEEINKVVFSKDENVFLQNIRYSYDNKVPLVFNYDSADDHAKHFTSLYNGEGYDLKSSDNGAEIKKSDQAIFLNTDDIRVKALAAQIATKLKYDLVFDSKLLSQYSQVINFDTKKDSNIKADPVYRDFDSIYDYYNKVMGSSDYTIYVESEDLSALAAYMASYKNAKLTFQLPEKFEGQYFLWFIDRDKYSKDRYIEIYNKLKPTSNQGIGVITGNTTGDISLFINRILFYNKLNTSKDISYIDGLGTKNSTSYSDSGWNVNNIVLENYQDDKLNEKLSNSKYINIFTHGAPRVLLGIKDIPVLRAPVVVTEACSTMESLPNDSVAIDFISKGSVAYIGSLKIGGTSGVSGDTYLLSSSSFTLGNLITLNNDSIMDGNDNVPRAVLLGDPSFKLFDNIIKGDKTLDLPFKSNDDLIVPIYCNEKNRSAEITSLEKKYNILLEDFSNIDKNIKLLRIKNIKSGEVNLSTKVPLNLLVDKAGRYIYDSINAVSEQFLKNNTIALMMIVVLIIARFRIKGNLRISVKYIAFLVLSVGVLFLLDRFFDVGFEIKKLILYAILIDTFMNYKAFKSKLILLVITIFIPLSVILSIVDKISLFNLGVILVYSLFLLLYSVLLDVIYRKVICDYKAKHSDNSI